jgi:hypothetical protein
MLAIPRIGVLKHVCTPCTRRLLLRSHSTTTRIGMEPKILSVEDLPGSEAKCVARSEFWETAC